jgi:pantetheine-phosphate adenylyltransferase
MALTAFYPGTFDPITNGHVDILRRALGIVDRLIVAIGVNPGKSPLFSGADRLAMISELTDQLAAQSGKDVSALMFDGLAVDAAKTEGATMLIRGLRDSSDFDYEMQMAGMNQSFAPDVVTVFLPSSPSVRHITATLVRQVAIAGRDVSLFVPEFVAQRIAQRLAT